MSSSPLAIPPALASRSIPLRELLDQHQGKRITVGVAVVTPGEPQKLLLLQRAADEDVLPNMYELPGGNCEDGDTTIFDTVVREAKEETGLVLSAVLNEFESFEYTTTKRGPARQLNFLVEVQQSAGSVDEGDAEPKPTLSANEHQAYVWIGAGDSLETLQMTDGMRTVVKNALRAMKEQRSH